MQTPNFEVLYLGDDWKNITIGVDVSLEDVSYGYYSQYYPELFIHHLSYCISSVSGTVKNASLSSETCWNINQYKIGYQSLPLNC